MFKTLSGRFLILTVLFVMLAEILIFVPSIARFRLDYLNARIERAQIASLALLADAELSPALEQELLANAQVYNVVLVRDAARQLVLSSPIPYPVEQSFDLRDPQPWQLVRDALIRLVDPADAVIRVIGLPSQQAGQLIEVTLDAAPLRDAMIDYGRRVFVLSLVISVITAALLFFAVRVLIVVPIKRVAKSMTDYSQAPQDIRRILTPDSKITEIQEAEQALHHLQAELSAALRHKERLAALGQAVAKISHDLRNILSSVQLLSDRMEESQDPMVQKIAPRLMRSVSRAVSLTENTLAFGRAGEPSPRLEWVDLSDIVTEVAALETLALNVSDGINITYHGPNLTLRADPEQLHRILQNLVRNARQAMQAASCKGDIVIAATQTNATWTITVTDHGPGLSQKAHDKLFQAFAGGTRKDGTGLGLAIAAELVAGHGGTLDLRATGPDGSVFGFDLPKSLT